jgi:hypothetical protein
MLPIVTSTLNVKNVRTSWYQKSGIKKDSLDFLTPNKKTGNMARVLKKLSHMQKRRSHVLNILIIIVSKLVVDETY